MKRVGHIMEKITTVENIRQAYSLAKRKHRYQKDVMEFEEDLDGNIEVIRQMLINGEYKSSPYHEFDICDKGKIRHISSLPFLDRIVHWAVVLQIQDIIVKNLISQTYAALPGRGTHQALRHVKKAVRDPRVKWCAKFDIHHYFQNIDKDILMFKLKCHFKDTKLLSLLSEIIYGYPGSGIPIGNLTSQYFANFYLSEVDHYFKEDFHAKYYFRYMDDILILGKSASWLRRAKKKLDEHLCALGLELNTRWQIFPLSEGVDFVGYRVWPTYSLLRSNTKRRMKMKMKNIKLQGYLDISAKSCVQSYCGILQWCNSYHLYKKYIIPVMEMMK